MRFAPGVDAGRRRPRRCGRSAACRAPAARTGAARPGRDRPGAADRRPAGRARRVRRDRGDARGRRVRARRRPCVDGDATLAVLKTLGFDRRQVRADGGVAGDDRRRRRRWSSGIPLGLIVGRFVWGIVADELGVSTESTWPVLAIVAARSPRPLLAGQPRRRVPRPSGRPHPPCSRPTIGVTVATSLDDIQPLDLASIRDDAPERPPWTSRATGVGRARDRRGRRGGRRRARRRPRAARSRPCALRRAGRGVGARRGVRRRPPSAASRSPRSWRSPRSSARLALFGAALAGRDVATATVRDFGVGAARRVARAVPGGRPAPRARRPRRRAGHAGAAALGRSPATRPASCSRSCS